MTELDLMRDTASAKSISAPWRTTLVSLVLVATACVSEPTTTGNTTTVVDEPTATLLDEPTATVVDEPTSTVVDEPGGASSDKETDSGDSATASTGEVPPNDTTHDLAALPIREGPRERTTESVPHVQLDAAPVPEVDAELRLRAFAIPGVEDQPTTISLAGTRALWFSDDVDLARPEILLSGREFAHIHPDGSLHVWLSVERALEVDAAAWGELHPWVERADFWDGVVMVFTPKTPDEVDVVMQLLVEAYNYISGLDLDPNDF